MGTTWKYVRVHVCSIVYVCSDILTYDIESRHDCFSKVRFLGNVLKLFTFPMGLHNKPFYEYALNDK